LKAARARTPDVILVGEMRDLETISTAIPRGDRPPGVRHAAHAGHAPAIDRIVDVFESAQQGQIRAQLSVPSMGS